MRTRLAAIAVSLLATTAISTPSFAGAGDDCCDDIEDLQRQLLLLQSQIDELKERSGTADHTVTWDPVPRIARNDERFTWTPRGRLLIDFNNMDVSGEPVPGAPPRSSLDLQNTELRSARLGVEGTVFGSTHYVFEVEFADDPVLIGTNNALNIMRAEQVGMRPELAGRLAGDRIVGHEDGAGIKVLDGGSGDIDVRITDAYLFWDLGRSTRLKVGQFKEPVTMGQRTSLAHTDTIEKPQLATTFGFGRRTGVAFEILRQKWLLSFGGYAENINVQIPSGEEGYALATRASWTPIRKDDRLLFLGASWMWRDYAADFPFATYFVRPPSSDALPFASLGVFPADHDLFWGIEGAASWGPVSLQGEFGRMKPDLPGDINPDDPIFTSWYGQAGWFLTGENRSFSLRDGAFSRTRVRRPVNEGGWGAWQLVARYEQTNLIDDPRFEGGDQTTWTAGINWLLNDYVKLMANYSRAEIDGSNGFFNVLLDDLGLPSDLDIDTIELRAQIDFGAPSTSPEIGAAAASGERNGTFLFDGEAGLMRVSFPDWSYGSNGSSGPMFAFDQGEDWAPNFHVSGAYQPNEAWLGDRSRFGLYIDYYGYFNDQVETSLSKSDGPDLYVAFDGTTAIGTAPPETNAFLSFSYNFWETGIESEVDFDLGERLRFTPSVAVFGGGQQQEYHASISDGGPIGGPTSFDNEFLQDVDTWHAGAGVGLEVGVAVASWLDVYLGGNVAYLRVSSDLKSTDCIDLIAGDDMCDGGFLAAASKDEQTFDTYRAGAEAGLKLNFGNMAFGVVGELRHDFVPEIDNPQSLGIRSRLESNHETSYGGRATMSVAF